MAKITQLPKATAVTDSDIAVIVQDGETRQIPRTMLAPPAPDDLQKDGNAIFLSVGGETVGNGIEIPNPPDGLQLDGNTLHLTENGVLIGTGAELPTPVTVDSAMSEASENPVQNKAITAAIQELETGIIAKTPTDLKLENNQLQLIAGNTAIGNGVQIRKTPTLLDTFTIAEGEEPVLFFEKKLVGQGWKHIWLSGEIYSSDKSNATQTFHIRTSAGSEIFRQSFKSWDKGRVFVSAEMCRMPNGLVIGEIALSLHQYTNEIGIYSKSVGRFNTQYLLGVHISLDNQTQMFAAGTRIEVWGLE